MYGTCRDVRLTNPQFAFLTGSLFPENSFPKLPLRSVHSIKLANIKFIPTLGPTFSSNMRIQIELASQLQHFNSKDPINCKSRKSITEKSDKHIYSWQESILWCRLIITIELHNHISFHSLSLSLSLSVPYLGFAVDLRHQLNHHLTVLWCREDATAQFLRWPECISPYTWLLILFLSVIGFYRCPPRLPQQLLLHLQYLGHLLASGVVPTTSPPVHRDS